MSIWDTSYIRDKYDKTTKSTDMLVNNDTETLSHLCYNQESWHLTGMDRPDFILFCLFIYLFILGVYGLIYCIDESIYIPTIQLHRSVLSKLAFRATYIN